MRDRGASSIILSRNSYANSPIQVIDITSKDLVCRFNGKTIRTSILWDRGYEDTYNQEVTIYDLPYIVLDNDVYPLKTFKLQIKESEYYYLILGDAVDYTALEENINKDGLI